MTIAITITKRTARNTCYTIVDPSRHGGCPQKRSMLHDKFAAMLARSPEYAVTDLAK